MAIEGSTVLLVISVFVLAAVGFSFMFHMRKLVRMLLVGAGLAAAVTLGVVLARRRSEHPKSSGLGGSDGPLPNNMARPVGSSEELPQSPPMGYYAASYAPPPAIAGPVRDARIRNFNQEQSERYISNLRGFRTDQNLTMIDPSRQVRLNLGEDFREYMIDSDLQRRVDALVEDPRTQIWSDVQTLSLSGTLVRDISPLARLTNLRTLYLSFTEVQDISPLAALTNLETLSLSRTQVRDISPLAGLTSLKVLYLYNTQVSDIRPLAGLQHLQALDVRHAPVVHRFVPRGTLQVIDESNTTPNVRARSNSPVNDAPAHAQTLTVLPDDGTDDENPRECKICYTAVATQETLSNFVKLEQHDVIYCRGCIARVNGCPICRAPLGPLPPAV